MEARNLTALQQNGRRDWTPEMFKLATWHFLIDYLRRERRGVKGNSKVFTNMTEKLHITKFF